MIWWIIGGVVIIGAAAWGPIVSNKVEQAKYDGVGCTSFDKRATVGLEKQLT